MDGFVDIHSHLLPGIDDGPRDLAGSLDMARAAAAAGTSVLAATPHLRADFPGVHVSEIAAQCEQIQAEINAAGIELRVVVGAETSLGWALEASDAELDLATYGQRGSDLLIETPPDVSMLEQLLFQVRARGKRVTLAHPERSGAFKNNSEPLARLSEQGVLLQVNAQALLAPRRSTTRRLAEQLCRDGHAHVLASDGHRGREWRPVSELAAGVEALSEMVGPERALWMARDAPAAIVAGAELPAAPPLHGARRGFWRRGKRSASAADFSR
ncbi:MAG: protein-tyrosine phosphatase [Solirubrobacteraceae bacterium]|nr:protein-tyrosine phosphatase [Solirubrobacteraceae bacterium]